MRTFEYNRQMAMIINDDHLVKEKIYKRRNKHMADVMLNYDRRVKLLKELILDCDPQVGIRAVGIQRSLDRAFENKEISQEELNDHEAKLDGMMHSFAYDCHCKKKEY